MKRLRADEVFPIAAHEVPHTYVSRAAAETLVQSQLRHQNAIILFSGPSKSGKTVLCHRFAAGLPKAHLHVFTRMTSDEFWDALRQAIEAPERTELERHDQRGSEIEVGGAMKTGANVLGVKAEAEAKLKKQWKESEGGSRKIVVPSGGRVGVLNYLRTHPHTIIIDDYHWMNPDIAPEVFPPLKQALGWGSRVILISVSNASFPTTGDFGDFTGRFVDLAMPPWDVDEIRQIARSGFPLLNMDVSKRTILLLASCAYGSPLLMQGLCSQLCYEQSIHETLDEKLSVDIKDRSQIGRLAGRFAQPLTTKFDALLSDPSSRIWKTRDRRDLSLAELLVLGINHKRPFEPILLSEVVERLTERVLKKPVPSTLSALLVQRITEIQTKLGGERGDRSPIYYDPVAKTVTIVDPYFKLWARWVRGAELSGKLFRSE